MNFKQPVLIAGGGIGGLAAAIALGECGMPTHVLEAEPDYSESGAGIQIGPNGSRILRGWGLRDALDSFAGKPDKITLGDGRSGKILAEIPLGSVSEARYGAPYYVTERAVLHRLLRQKAGDSELIEVTPGFRLISFRHDGNSVMAMSQDGREIAGRALIGADGVHSATRMLLFGRRPRPSGRKAWRATSQLGAGPAGSGNAIQLWFGARAHLVHYDCAPQGPLNAVAVTHGSTETSSWGAPGEALELKPSFADWEEGPYSLLRDFDDWSCWPLLQMEPLTSWSDGLVTLTGDAAHPIMPFLASGAVMAIEDAASLASELSRYPDLPAAAFRNYERHRRGRIARVRDGAARMGAIYHMQGPMRLARNMTLGLLPCKRLLQNNDWLYGYCV